MLLPAPNFRLALNARRTPQMLPLLCPKRTAFGLS